MAWMKATLTIDMPESCLDCIACIENESEEGGHICAASEDKMQLYGLCDYEATRPTKCPLVECNSIVMQIKCIEEMIEVQSRSGTYDYDAYMHGMANGMIYIHSILTDQEPKYLTAPSKWLKDIEENLEPIRCYPES